MYYIIRTQVTQNLTMADYVRTQELETAIAVARALVDTDRVYAAEVRTDDIQYTLVFNHCLDEPTQEKSP